MDQSYLDKEGLAAAFGVSLTTVTNWVRRGCPYEERGGKGRPWKFSLPKVLAWHRKYHGKNSDSGRRSSPSSDELPDILKQRPDYGNPLRAISEIFAKDVFYHWLNGYCRPFLMLCREAGLERETAFRLFQQAAYLHISAIVDAVSEDFINRGLADMGGVDEVSFQLSRIRVVTAPPPEPEEQVEFELPAWLTMKADAFIARYWTEDIDRSAVGEVTRPVKVDGVG